MGIEDNDVIDRALDAAEAKLIDTEAEAAPSPETEASETPGTDKLIEDAELKKVLDKENSKPVTKAAKTRDESGKFQKTTKKAAPKQILSDQETDVSDPEATLTAPVAEESPVEIPAFWSAELKKAAAEAPPALVKKFAEHDAQREQWARRSVSEAEPAKAIVKRLYEGFEPVKDEARLNGIDNPVDELERYRAWDNIFKRDTMTGVVDLARKNGITPEQFAQAFYGYAEANPPSDPRIDEALQEAKQAKQMAEQYQQQLAQQSQATLVSEVETFKKGKDSTGQVREPFAKLYAPQIAQEYDRLVAENPHLRPNEVLTQAYENIVGSARKAFGINGKPAQPTTVDVKKAQSIASSANGAPALGKSAARPPAKSIDEAIDRAEEKLGYR